MSLDQCPRLGNTRHNGITAMVVGHGRSDPLGNHLCCIGYQLIRLLAPDSTEHTTAQLAFRGN